MSDKEIYRNHCEQNMNIPLFLSFAWINTVCKENEWDVILKLGGNDVHGFLVYHKKKKLGQNYITMPPLTPYTGVWINYPEHQKQTTRISFERKVMEFLISRLPKFDFCVMHLHPYISNWQPFYWNDFQQTTRYTYILDNQEEEDLYNGLRDNIRREIKKAQATLSISYSENPAIISEIKTVTTKNSTEPFWYKKDFLDKIQNALGKRMTVLSCKDDNQTIGTVLLVNDTKTTYYLTGAIMPEYKTSGALSWMLWEGIKASINCGRSFNFEGSMIKPIERFFSSFGAKQVPYHRITKANSIVSKAKNLISDI